MKCFVIAAMMGVFLSSCPVWAEMYRYKDAGGVVRFTDNLADIPEKQRSGASVYEKTPTAPEPSANEKTPDRNTMNGPESKMTEPPREGDTVVNSSQSDALPDDPSRIERLLKIKTALDEENAQFVKESLALSEEKKTLSGNDAIQAFNEKVSVLNARVDDYEKRRAAFQKEVDAFDAALKKRMAPAPQSPPPVSPP